MKQPTKRHLSADARDFRAIDRDARDIHRRVRSLTDRDKHVGKAAGKTQEAHAIEHVAQALRQREPRWQATEGAVRSMLAMLALSKHPLMPATNSAGIVLDVLTDHGFASRSPKGLYTITLYGRRHARELTQDDVRRAREAMEDRPAR